MRWSFNCAPDSNDSAFHCSSLKMTQAFERISFTPNVLKIIACKSALCFLQSTNPSLSSMIPPHYLWLLPKSIVLARSTVVVIFVDEPLFGATTFLPIQVFEDECLLLSIASYTSVAGTNIAQEALFRAYLLHEDFPERE